MSFLVDFHATGSLFLAASSAARLNRASRTQRIARPRHSLRCWVLGE
jgi:hypothetical protein